MPDSRRLVIGIAGRIGSGKTVVARCLENSFGFQYLRYSLILAEWFHADPGDKARLQDVGEAVMVGQNQGELNRRLIQRVNCSGDVVVDGLRHPLDREILANEFCSCFFLVFVDTPLHVRFDRVRGRYVSYENFLLADSRQVESHINSLQSAASIVISGTKSHDCLESELNLILSTFRWRVGT